MYDKAQLRERFHKVILGAGYSETAAQGILEQHFDEAMKDVPAFVKMLEKYEPHEETSADSPFTPHDADSHSNPGRL